MSNIESKESIKQTFLADYYNNRPNTLWVKPEFVDNATDLIYSGVKLIVDSSIANVEIETKKFVLASVALIVKHNYCSGYVAEVINEAALNISKGNAEI